MTAWPDGMRAALALTFDVDADEGALARDPENAGRIGARSQGLYGVRRGQELILDLLARHEAPATFFVPGRVAERFPAVVEAIAAAGHELAHHGYTHRPPTALSRAEEAEELDRGLAALRGAGAEVAGYRSPSWEFTDATLELLGERAFRYSSNLMDDVHPYRHEGGLVELPVQWILDDAPHFAFSRQDWTSTILPARLVQDLWLEELDGIAGLGGACILTMHPHVIGRPGRLPVLERVIEWARERGDVWIARCDEIADCV